MKQQNENESRGWTDKSFFGLVSATGHEELLLKCTQEEADVQGPGLQGMYRPGHMEVDGGIQLVSTGPQRAHSSTQGEEWGVACPLPNKWTTQQKSPKGNPV